jgi:hypothetical protein
LSFLKKLFAAPPKQRTGLDDTQEVGGRLIIKPLVLQQKKT